VEITRFTPPRIVREDEVKEEEKPPEQSKLADCKIGSINQEGIKDEGIVQGPGSDAGKGVVEGLCPSRSANPNAKMEIALDRALPIPQQNLCRPLFFRVGQRSQGGRNS
jgi:hypothetical protein